MESREPEAPSPGFLLDGMLGTLAKKMRMLGFDAEFSADEDDTLIRYRSLSEGRIVLTRDARLAERLGEDSWLVSGMDAREEFASVLPFLRPLGLPVKPLTRCLDCNAMLRELDREGARNMVPRYVWMTAERFMVCPRCKKCYWHGTHTDRMLAEIGEMVEALTG
ncbi:MAG TPA: hypothetical protein ENH32_02775 [Proteobacteria bacterium]|nr:hypothetical protein BMS3Abin14_01137 [bacterium BMS3Abin14]HDL52879.1 hypothetical protein [Pseudomonadota bacterium]